MVISNGSSTGEHAVPINGGIGYEPFTADAVINYNTLQTTLATSNVTVSTQSNYSSAGDITVAHALTWSSHTLTLDAYRSIVFEKTVSVTGAGGLTITTNDCGCSGGGDYYFNGGKVTFTVPAAALTINTIAYTVEHSLASLASAISNNASGNFALANDISGGTWSAPPITTNFQGTMEGLGNTISNLTINVTGNNAPLAVGMFEQTSSNGTINATIRDLTLSNPQVSADNGASFEGGLVGASIATDFEQDFLTNVSVSSTSPGTGTIGGMVGQIINGSITGSSVTGSSTVSFSPPSNTITFPLAIGGLIGSGDGGSEGVTYIRNSSSGANVTTAGSVLPSNSVFAGGLVGSGGFCCLTSGGLAIFDSNATGNVSAPAEIGTGAFVDAGGLAGYLKGSLSGSYASGAVSGIGKGSGVQNVGGLIGDFGYYSHGSITSDVTYSYATGSVSIGDSLSNGGNAGGLIGDVENGTSVSDSYATGSVSGFGAAVGGLVGLNDGTVSTNYAAQTGTGLLIGSVFQGAKVGGLVGANEYDGTISQDFSAPAEGSNASAISGPDSSWVGGLAGYNNGMIENSYSYPSYSILCPNCAALISGSNSSDVGGLVGNEDNGPNALITSSYSTGSVPGSISGGSVGGSIGFDNQLAVSGTKQYVYWDTDTSGTTCAAGNNGCSTDSGITGETTTQLQGGLPTGFGSPPWAEVSGVNNGLPCLTNLTGGCGN